MLQIISGRFFGDGKINEREMDAILYGNFSWIGNITTKVAELRPTDFLGGRISSFVVRYTLRYEPSPGDVLVMPTGHEAAEQFRLLCCLWFNSFFHSDRIHVETLCRSSDSVTNREGAPCRFVDGFFDAPIRGTSGHVEFFSPFVNKVLGMPRASYNLFMSCLGTWIDALEAIDTNRDLAYSMFVYLLEALSASGGKPDLKWEDFPEQQRIPLDKVLAEVDPNRAEHARAVLLEGQHLKLRKRFTEFVADHIAPSFFTTEAAGRPAALQHNELHNALDNLYSLRSGYVHSLTPLQTQLTLPICDPNTDVIHWEHRPYLTFAGLARLTRHVLTQFAHRQPVSEREDFPNWRSEVPGIIMTEMAPQYWAAKVETFAPQQIRKRVSGFYSHLVTSFGTGKYNFLDMRPLMERIEELVSQASPDDRRSMLTFYWMFNSVIPEADRRPGWSEFLERHAPGEQPCSIDLLAAIAAFEMTHDEKPEVCEAVFEAYLKSKFKKHTINLPWIIEVGIMLTIANGYLAEGNTQKFEHWANRALLNSAGKKQVQDSIAAHLAAERKPFEIGKLIGRPGA